MITIYDLEGNVAKALPWAVFADRSCLRSWFIKFKQGNYGHQGWISDLHRHRFLPFLFLPFIMSFSFFNLEAASYFKLPVKSGLRLPCLIHYNVLTGKCTDTVLLFLLFSFFREKKCDCCGFKSRWDRAPKAKIN